MDTGYNILLILLFVIRITKKKMIDDNRSISAPLIHQGYWKTSHNGRWKRMIQTMGSQKGPYKKENCMYIKVKEEETATIDKT